MHYFSAFNGISMKFRHFRAELCSVQKLFVTQQTLISVLTTLLWWSLLLHSAAVRGLSKQSACRSSKPIWSLSCKIDSQPKKAGEKVRPQAGRGKNRRRKVERALLQTYVCMNICALSILLRSCKKFNARNNISSLNKERIETTMETQLCVKLDADRFGEITVTDCCKVIVGTFFARPIDCFRWSWFILDEQDTNG